MFKVFILACVLAPFPRGDILVTKCYTVDDIWAPHKQGYLTKKQCVNRLETIKGSIEKNFKYIYIKKSFCKKTDQLI